MSAAKLAKSQTKSQTKTEIASLAQIIDAAFERREAFGPATKGAVREAVAEALLLLDRGAATGGGLPAALILPAGNVVK